MIKLRAILKDTEYLSMTVSPDISVNKIEFYAGKVEAGDIYVALVGGRADGGDFIAEALSRGAAAVVTEKDLEDAVPHVKVKNARRALALMSANFYGNPAEELKLVGVTGTNGKTTTAYLINEILKNCGKVTGYIGTLYYEIAGRRFESTMTTPDPFLLQGLLFEMKEAGVEVVVMEVSAHAVFYEKTYGIKFDIGIFTNLTQDHLDFFRDMTHYKEVKKSFFTRRNCALALVNIDDPAGCEILAETDLPVITYGLENPSDTFALAVRATAYGTDFVINVYDRVAKISTALSGRFNVYNFMAAATAAVSLGADLDAVARAAALIAPPEGRFNVYFKNGVKYVLDYAHTPDGLLNLLKTARDMAGRGRLITVFGCGGGRDSLKRPVMGGVASEFSDIIILTNDNPRYEDPLKIIEEIKSGINYAEFGNKSERLEILPQRGEAIARAVEISSPGDIVVIAGKGQENYIEANGVFTHFSDKEELLKLLNR